jgi:uncharacterized protein YeaO (DUF488 family)
VLVDPAGLYTIRTLLIEKRRNPFLSYHNAKTMINLARVYDKENMGSGLRILVDKMWPRGLSKTDLKLDRWAKDIAPSDDLRKWFSHDPAKWDEFRVRYFTELNHNPSTGEFVELCKGKEVIFLYSSKESRFNNAVALKEYIQRKISDQ